MLREFVNEVRGEDESSGLVHFDRFEKAATRVLLEAAAGEQARDSEEKMLRAFKVRGAAAQGGGSHLVPGQSSFACFGCNPSSRCVISGSARHALCVRHWLPDRF